VNDPLHDYLKTHKPKAPPVPHDEWQRILQRTRQDGKRRQHRVWYYVSAATLAAAGMMAFLNFAPKPQDSETWLEPEDVLFQVEPQDRGAYQDWLWIADQVVAEAGG
jgi:hypothetical protein